MVHNTGLIMFYVTKFMQENVYYCKKEAAYVIAEIEEDRLFIHSIFADRKVDLDEIIASFGKAIKYVTLGFTPIDGKGYDMVEVNEEDTTLFVKGIGEFKEWRVMFPTLSHA